MDTIDLRSDTVTVPTQEMRDSILTAEVGDDVYGDDPTVNQLQSLFAQIVKKETSLFMPTGSMANQIAYMVSSQERGMEILVPQDSHTFQFEVGGLAALSGIQVRFYKQNRITGEVDVEDIEQLIRKKEADFFPITSCIVIQNPTSFVDNFHLLQQGSLISIQTMKQIYEIAKKWKIHVHLDGARLFNAAHALKVDPSHITLYCDSVTTCLSKGLCAPVGSMLAGSQEFFVKAKRYRKMMGGGMRQVGILAAPGIIALTKIAPLTKIDNEIAVQLAQELRKFPQLSITEPQINFVQVKLSKEIDLNKFDDFLKSRNIKLSFPSTHDTYLRIAVHYYIREKEVLEIVKAFTEYLVK